MTTERLWPAVERAVLVACLLLGGCRPSLEGDLRTSGRFTGLEVVEAEGALFAAAIDDGDADQKTLTLTSLTEDGRSCTVPGVTAYFPRTGPEDRLGVVAWTPGTDGCGTLAFLDSSCRPLMQPIACTPEPTEVVQDILGGRFRHRLIVASEGGPMRLVDPWAGEELELAPAVEDWRWAGDATFWLVGRGSLSLRDLDGGGDRQLGADVNEAVFMKGGAAAFSDRDGVWLVRSRGAEPELLAADACRPSVSQNGKELAYLAPCADKRLVSHNLESGVITPVATGVTAFRTDTTPWFYTTGAADAGPLFAAASGAPLAVAEQAKLSSVRRVAHDGRTSHLLLAGLDGEHNGDLRRFDGATTTTLIADVAAFQVRHDHIAAVVGAEAGTGTLVLRPEADAGENTVLARRVPVERFLFGSQLEAIGFLRDFDGRAGTLELVSLTTDDRYVLDGGVSELVEVRSDRFPGVAYIVREGERAGIWFAAPG